MEKDLPLETIFRGVIPFVACMLLSVVILTVFPQIALWLPRLFLSDRVARRQSVPGSPQSSSQETAGAMASMNPKERMLCAAAGKRPDKLPLFAAAANSFICSRYRLSISDYLENAGACAQATTDFIQEYELDSCVSASGYIFYGCGPEMGVDWRFTAGEFPGFGQGPLRSKADLEMFRAPRKPSGYFKRYLEIVARVSAALGGDHHLIANILGPLEKLKPHAVRDTMGAFMGRPEDPESQKDGRALYRAFFGVNDSIEDIENAFRLAPPGMPFPLAVSGRMLDSWEADRIVGFLDQAVDFLVRRHGVYPSLTLISVQAGTPEKARDISRKLKIIRGFRDGLRLS